VLSLKDFLSWLRALAWSYQGLLLLIALCPGGGGEGLANCLRFECSVLEPGCEFQTNAFSTSEKTKLESSQASPDLPFNTAVLNVGSTDSWRFRDIFEGVRELGWGGGKLQLYFSLTSN
jgi:hypothetical protein